MRVAVLTISDTVSRGEREDLSGPAVVAVCRGLGWEVTSVLRVSDDPANIREQLRELADSGRVDLILSTGGTGIGPRDNTPESTEAVADRIVPGIAEEIRRKGIGTDADGCAFARSRGGSFQNADRKSARQSKGRVRITRCHRPSFAARCSCAERRAARLAAITFV